MLIYAEQHVPREVRIITYRGTATSRVYCPSEFQRLYPGEEFVYMGRQLISVAGRGIEPVMYVNVTRRVGDPRTISILTTSEFVVPSWTVFVGVTEVDVPNPAREFAEQATPIPLLKG